VSEFSLCEESTNAEGRDSDNSNRGRLMLMILVTTLLAVLYGLAWHNEPANPRRSAARNKR